MNAEMEPVFIYDFNSPYAYLAAARIDEILPVRPTWQPVALAFLLRAHQREPWSFDEHERALGILECERRAERYGLPAMRWPPGWPVHSYGLTSLRAAILAADRGLLREFSHAAFARNFVTGQGLASLTDVLSTAAEVGLDPEAIERGVASDEIKRRLTAATDGVLAAGAVGVPSVLTAMGIFWGDDRLEEAAAAVAGDRP